MLCMPYVAFFPMSAITLLNFSRKKFRKNHKGRYAAVLRVGDIAEHVCINIYSLRFNFQRSFYLIFF